jgi:hypothetical protein
LAASFRNEILPRGIIEQINIDDIIESTWEILRLRRRKTAIVNRAFKEALRVLRDFQSDTGPRIVPNDGSMAQPPGPRSLKFSTT